MAQDIIQITITHPEILQEQIIILPIIMEVITRTRIVLTENQIQRLIIIQTIRLSNLLIAETPTTLLTDRLVVEAPAILLTDRLAVEIQTALPSDHLTAEVQAVLQIDRPVEVQVVPLAVVQAIEAAVEVPVAGR